MVKAKREMKKKKMTIAEYRRQKLKERLPEARVKTLLEQGRERQKMEGAKALRELEREKEKIGSEKAKRIGTITELRDLYPELSDSDFMRFVKSQFGFDVPAETRAMARESGEDKGFTQSVLSSLSKIKKVETLMKKIEEGEFTGRKRLQILDAVKKLELRQRTEKAEEEKRVNQAKESEKAKQRMEEEKLVNEAKEAEAFAQELVGKKKKKKKVQGEPQGEGEGEAEAPPKKTLVITKKKQKSEQPEVKLEQEEATALREKLVEQEAQQAQQADTEALLNMPDIAPELSQEEGLGLVKRYAIHPSRFTKDKGGILSLNKKGVKHLNNVAKILHPKHLKNVVEFSVLNKIRNDFIARKIKRQMQRQKAKGGELESDNSVSGGGFFGSILDGIF